jgi:hypothetical protein
MLQSDREAMSRIYYYSKVPALALNYIVFMCWTFLGMLSCKWWKDELIIFDQWQLLLTVLEYREHQAAVACPLVEMHIRGDGDVQKVAREAFVNFFKWCCSLWGTSKLKVQWCGIFIIYLRIICDAELHTRFNFEVDLVVSFDGNEKQFFHLGGSIHVSDMFWHCCFKREMLHFYPFICDCIICHTLKCKYMCLFVPLITLLCPSPKPQYSRRIW